jgi:O-antigen/teichoic acid export membrane protein
MENPAVRFSAATTAERLLPARVAQRSRPFLDRIDRVLAAQGEEGQAGRLSLAAFLIRVLSAVIAFASQVLLARWMGSFEYGIFVLVWVTMIIVGNLSCLGVHTSVIRFVPEYLQAERHAELRGIVLSSRLFALIVSTLIAGLGALGLHLMSASIEPYYLVPFYLGLIAVPMLALSDVLQGIARAYSWVVAALTPTYLTRPLLILAFLAGATSAGYAPDARTAVVAAILATYLTTFVQFIRIAGRADARPGAGPRAYEPATWAAVTGPIFLVESFFFLLTNADVLMVGRFMDPHDVAVYFAAVKTLAVAHFVYFAVKAGVAQRYAHYAHSGDRDRLAEFARETAKWTFFPSVAVGLGVLATGNFLLGLFGPGFDDGYPLLFVLIGGIVARAAVGPAESVLTMSGHQKACAGVYAAALAFNIGLSVLLIPAWGLWGAAAATSLAMVFEAILLGITVWRRLGIVMTAFLRPAHGRG